MLLLVDVSVVTLPLVLAIKQFSPKVEGEEKIAIKTPTLPVELPTRLVSQWSSSMIFSCPMGLHLLRSFLICILSAVLMIDHYMAGSDCNKDRVCPLNKLSTSHQSLFLVGPVINYPSLTF